jgi:prevent-host-death family protein
VMWLSIQRGRLTEWRSRASMTIKMTTLGTVEAKSHFSEIIDRASRGEEIVITKRGVPVAKVVSIKDRSSAENRKALLEKLRAFRKGKKTFRKEGENWNDIAREGLR